MATTGSAALILPRFTAKARNMTPSDHPLESMIADITPITVAERQARIDKARRLMAGNNIDALILEPGTAMLYFTGIRWWRSERLTAVVIPQKGEIAVVTPYFEEPSVRESLSFGDDVRTWNEHENPFERLAGILADRGLSGGRIGVEETVRYFVIDGLHAAAPAFETVSATPVTLGCRMYKSAHEIALMKRASDITIAAYRHTARRLEAGMAPADIARIMHEATVALGGESQFELVLMGEASAYPHGSRSPQVLRQGEVVLMDCGCAVEGYQSDISRSFVFGQASPHQRQVWNTVHAGQQLAFKSAKIGLPAGSLDDTVRGFYESKGYGPGYRTPGLSHRLGHGIGMDGHERVNLVHGETTPLAPGMCFSNEPGIYSFGQFGIRLEDCFYMTDDGPRWFSEPAPSLDDPFGLKS